MTSTKASPVVGRDSPGSSGSGRFQLGRGQLTVCSGPKLVRGREGERASRGCFGQALGDGRWDQEETIDQREQGRVAQTQTRYRAVRAVLGRGTEGRASVLDSSGVVTGVPL